jgi:macrolide-specific efflux system membrane fusion protein
VKHKKVRRRLKAILILTAALIPVFWGISLAFFQDNTQVSYLTAKVSRGRIVHTVVTTGEVASAQLVNVGAQVSGKIERLLVETGDQVTVGQLIAEIDSTTQRNTLESERARLNTYMAQLTSRETALKTAQSKFDRESRLKKGDATSTENLEAAEQALAAAKAALEETKSMILQTSTAVNTAETNLAYTKITSPLAGTVVSVPVKRGQTVNANQTTPTIAQIADLTKMEIKLQISEGDITKVRPGLTVNYVILSEPERRFSGRLKSVDPGLTTVSDGSYNGSTDSGTAVYYYGKVDANNADGTLRVGMTTQNSITIFEADDVLIIPTVALSDIVSSAEGGSQTRRARGGGGEDNQIRRGTRAAGDAGLFADPDRQAGRSPAGRENLTDGEENNGTAGDAETSAAGRAPGSSAADSALSKSANAVSNPSETTRPQRGIRHPSEAGRVRAVVQVMRMGQPEDKTIIIGVSDNMNTEVLEGLEDGDEVVVAKMTDAEMRDSRQTSQNPGNRQRMGGGLPRF